MCTWKLVSLLWLFYLFNYTLKYMQIYYGKFRITAPSLKKNKVKELKCTVKCMYVGKQVFQTVPLIPRAESFPKETLLLYY